MSSSWHSRLCQVLDALYAEHAKAIFALPVIQLRGSHRVSPKEAAGRILICSRDMSIEIPPGIPSLELHPDAVGDASRRALYQRFKAIDAGPKEVCELILSTHRTQTFSPGEVGKDTLVAHLKFLANAQVDKPV